MPEIGETHLKKSERAPGFYRNACLFTGILLRIVVPFKPPPPNQQSDGFHLEICIKRTSNKIANTLSQNCEFLRNTHERTKSSVTVGDKFGESLGGSQAPPSFWEVPGLFRMFPELPRKFFSDFPGSSLTVELNSNPEVPWKFRKLPRKFPRLPRKFPDFPGGQPLSLGSLTPSPDSQKLSLIQWPQRGFQTT